MRKIGIFLVSFAIIFTSLVSCTKETLKEKPYNNFGNNSSNNSNSSSTDTPKKLVEKVTYSVETVIPEQNYYLNSATYLGFNKQTKTVIPFKVPYNAVKIFYRVAVTEGKTPVKNLRLAGQVAGILVGNPLISTISSKIETPEQGTSGRMNFYLLDYTESLKFENDNNFRYFTYGTREGFKNGVIEIDERLLFGRTELYIGVHNPRTITGQSFSIEAIAIIKKTQYVYE